ncbi:hypothetical protein [Achromobacter animicus]|uniref:hypothetical protein n=1 Tax=Achromobacter animicus TaxID=1389935 RepID=UPI0015826BBD|nr:hypothetical protein [Achromobacter animicus]
MKNAYNAVAKDPSKGGGVNININDGVSSSSQTSRGQSSTVSGAAVSAGRPPTATSPTAAPSGLATPPS